MDTRSLGLSSLIQHTDKPPKADRDFLLKALKEDGQLLKRAAKTLQADCEIVLEALPFGLSRIGDCLAPSTIAAAVYDGHRFARELDNPPEPDGVPFRREYTLI